MEKMLPGVQKILDWKQNKIGLQVILAQGDRLNKSTQNFFKENK